MKKAVRSILCILIVLAMAGGLTACGKKNKEDTAGSVTGQEEDGTAGSGQEEEDAADSGEEGEAFVMEYVGDDLPPLTLYADNTMFYEDEEKKLALTVRVPAEYAFDTIFVLDEGSDIVTEIGADEPSAVTDEYREYPAQVTIERSDAGVASLTAFMAQEDEAGGSKTLKSNSLDIYITGHVTQEMMKTCSNVGGDLQNYLTANSLEELFADGRGDECLAAVKEWLDKDARVLDAEIVGDTVMYHTTDHVLGMYMEPPEGGYFGGGDEEETGLSVSFGGGRKAAQAMENWEKNGYPGETEGEKIFLDGVLSGTNNKFLVMTPWADTADSALGWLVNHDVVDSGEKHYEMAQKFQSELGYSVKKTGYLESLCCIVNGELTDYGIITLMCHGGNVDRSDGTKAAAYCWPGTSDNYNGTEVFRLIAEEAVENGTISREDEFYRLFFHGGTFDADHTLMSLQGGSIIVGSNYIIQRYQNSFFDNAIFYAGSCYGSCDQKFIDFCMAHGMKAFIGYRNAVSAAAEPERFKRIFKQLKDTKKNGHTRTLDDSAKIVVAGSNLLTTRPHGSWRIKGLGDVSGKAVIKVTDVNIAEDGSRTEESKKTEPGKPVTVNFCRFMNQAFSNGRQFETKEDGTFTIKDLEWGVYGVTAQYDPSDPESKVFAGMTLADESFDAGTINFPRKGAEVKGNVYAADKTGAEVPVPSFDVVLSPKGGNAAEGKSYTAKGQGGTFELGDIGPGEYELKITANEGDWAKTVTLEDGYNYNYEKIVLEGDFWFKYIKKNIVPSMGYASLETASKTIGQNWNYPSVWDRRKGVIGAQTADFNNDGIEDCVLYYFDNEYVYTPGGQLITNDPKTVLYAKLLTKDSGGQVVEKESRQIFFDDSISFCDGIGGILEVEGTKYVYFEVNTNAYYANGGNSMYTLFTYDGESFRPAAAAGKTGGGSSELEYGLIRYDAGGQYTGVNVTDSSQAWYCADGNYSKEFLCVDGTWNGDREQVRMDSFDPKLAVQRGLEDITALPVDSISLENGPFDSYCTYRNSNTFTAGIHYNANGKNQGNGARAMVITVEDMTRLREEK